METDEEEGVWEEQAGEVAKSAIDKILGYDEKRPGPDGTPVPSFLVKWTDRSYLHADWISEKRLEAEGGKKRVKAFMSRWWDHVRWDVDERGGEYFDPSYTEVERVVASRDDGDGERFYVKWRNMPYADCTWEPLLTLEESIGVKTAQDKVADFRRFQELPSREDRARRPRPALPAGSGADARPDFVSECKFKGGNKLREYQQEGVNWLLYNWFQQRGAILADEMGLGKTVQAVGVLSYLSDVQRRRGPFLIVAPLSTIPHWLREAEAWTDLNCIVFHGNQESREIMKEHEFYFPDEPHDCLKFNVMITTWEVVMADEKDGGLLAGIAWDLVIVDEAHRLKNKDSKTFKSLQAFEAIPSGNQRGGEAHVILLTGTPIQNNTEELWCLLHFLAPTDFADKDAFLERFGTIHTAGQVCLHPSRTRNLSAWTCMPRLKTWGAGRFVRCRIS